MGLNGESINAIKGRPEFKEAFVWQLPNRPDVLVLDLSNLVRKAGMKCKTWADFRRTAEYFTKQSLEQCNTLLMVGDFGPYTPQCKSVDARLHRRIVRDGQELMPLSEAELKEDSITRRDSGMPSDMDRVFLTPCLKLLLSAVYAAAALKSCAFDPQLDPPKSIIIDGVVEEFDPLSSEELVPKVFRRHSATGGEVIKENRPRIGEADLAWVRWLCNVAAEPESKYGLSNPQKGPLILLDPNDSDWLIVALANLSCFLPPEPGAKFTFRLFMHYGSLSRWTNFLPMACLREDAVEARSKGKMIDVTQLWMLIVTKLHRGLGVLNPIEVFCSLILVGGCDYVKSVNGVTGEVTKAAPFKGLGPTSIMKTFFNNKAARTNFASQIKVKKATMNPGMGIAVRSHTHLNECEMVRLVSRYYMEMLRKYGMANSKGSVTEPFERLQAANIRKNEATAVKKRVVASDGVLSTAKVELSAWDKKEIGIKSRITTMEEAVATFRRIFWRMEYTRNGWTGQMLIDTDILVHQRTGLSMHGWKKDPNTGIVYATARVYMGE